MIDKNLVSVNEEKNENQLVVSHLYLVKFVVSRMTMNLPPGLTKDDLHAIGSMGLIDAAKKFDTKKGVQFKTYSVTRIRGAILDELRRYTLGGQTLCRKARQIEQATKAIEIRKKGSSASEEEVADELGISKEKLHKIKNHDIIQTAFIHKTYSKQYYIKEKKKEKRGKNQIYCKVAYH